MPVEQGDAFTLLSDLPTDHFHCAIIDYPWEFDYRNGTDRFNSGSDDAMYDMEPDNRFPELLRKLSRVLIDGSWAFFFSDDRFQDVVRDDLRSSSKFTFRRNWAWTPGRFAMSYYGRVAHYPIPTATLGETDRYVKDRPTLLQINGRSQVDYPSAKPASLYRKILAPPVIEDDERLIEPFCGSGPGARIAAERGLDYWGCDTEPEAVSMAQKHLKRGRSNLLSL